MIITKTPFRVSLFGGGSDHPDWFLHHGGQVLSFSIDKYCYLTSRILPPFFEHNYRVAYSVVETVRRFQDLQHPVVRESIRKFAPNFPLEIHHHGDLPARSGVGSSSAFTVGIIHSLLELIAVSPSPMELANLAIEMEQEILRENVGWQDQIACALGGLNHISFNENKSWDSHSISLSTEYQKAFESRMVLVFSGISRSSSDITASLIENFPSKKNEMTRLVELAEISKGCFENESSLDFVGEMLDEAWRIKKSLNTITTSPQLDEFYELAIRAGAISGKILGAGGGGFFLFWLKENGFEAFKSALKFGTLVPFRLSLEGSKVIYRSSISDETE
jgi:D-glycero-alpha-D-manno-heptose-7-phosphate kinase